MSKTVYDIRPLVSEIYDCVRRHELPTPGQYQRWLWQSKKGDRRLGNNEYGCADAANILYTIGEFGADEETRKARISVLRSLQDPETGMYTEETHHTVHTTAHCLAALELFDARPLYPVKGLHRYFDKNELYALLEGLDWYRDPWSQSHQGAGVYAALENAGEMTKEFSDNYFAWFWENADPITGMWDKKEAPSAPFSSIRNAENGKAAIYTHMAGSFHYLFNHEHAKMPLRYPEKMIDTCIKMYRENALPDYFARECGFIDVDWIYCISRASRQTAYKHDEVKALLYDMANRLIPYLLGIDYEKHENFNDLHMLFGTVCALAELQSALPGAIVTEKPLRLVLDRRPFI